jgi:hypothetical protein
VVVVVVVVVVIGRGGVIHLWADQISQLFALFKVTKQCATHRRLCSGPIFKP